MTDRIGLATNSRLPNILRILAATALLLQGSARAATGGSISGTVKDPSGAVIVMAKVVVHDLDRNIERTVDTNEAGFYAFTFLPVGRYAIEVRSEGFRPYSATDFRIDIGSALHVDVTLEVGQHNEQVTIIAQGTQVETASTQMGEVVAAKEITAVPLNGRSFTDLLSLQSGVVPVSSQQPNAVVMSGVTSTPPSGDLNAGNMSVSGQRETSNGFRINGSDAEEDVNMGTAIVPNLDSIAEFRILTNNFDAEYGNYSGGQILVTTKSGQNEFHGSGFDFLRNTALDAKNYFSSQRAAFVRNQYGGTLGGPIKRNRIFFFADYQGTRSREGVDTGRIYVPSLQDRTGDLADEAGSLAATFDSKTGLCATRCVNGDYWAHLLSQRLGSPVSAGEAYYYDQCQNTGPNPCVFPNAVIPESAWATPAQKLLQYIPTPDNSDGTFSTAAYDQTLHDEKGATRVDADTRWGSLSAYYFLDDYSLNNPYPTAQGGANVPGFNAVTFGRAQLLSLGATKAVGTTLVNEFHFSYMRDANNVGQPVGGVGPSLVSQGFVDAAGQPGIHPLAPNIEGVANVAFNDFTIGVDTTGLKQANNTVQWSDNFAKVVGKHTLSFGGEFHYDQINVNPDTVDNGSFLFTGSETGLDFADFLLGIPSNFNQAEARPFYYRNRYVGLYGQDTWQLKPSVTVNYGLRWDVIPPWHEKYNQLQTLVLGEQSRVYPGAPTGLVFPGDPGIPKTLAPTRYSSLAPRVGISYAPKFQRGLLRRIFGETSQTSLRAGYGVFFTAFEGLSASIMSANPPYGYDYNSLAPPLFATPFITATTGENVGQRFPLALPPLGASTSNPNTSVNWPQFLPITGVPSFSRDNVPPYAENYMFSIQHEIAQATVLSVSYVGTQGHHLLVLVPANPGDPAACVGVSQPSEVLPGTSTCGPFGESNVYTTASGQVVDGTRGPFSSQFAAITYQKTIANSNYNALEVSLRHDRGPLEILAGYTYSKSIDQSSSLAEEDYPANARLNRAISAFDTRHNFVASFRYSLPVNRVLRRSNRWTEGWSISGVTRFATGLPVTLYNNNDTSLLGTIPNGINNNGVDTPNFTRGNLEIHTNPRDGKPAFNTSLFSLPALGQLGTASRRFFYGPGIDNFDLAILKDVRLTESKSKSLQLRLEAFNAFNHAQFYGPTAVDGNISSPEFGRVVSAAAPRTLQLGAKFSF
jgi:hypothetical protein